MDDSPTRVAENTQILLCYLLLSQQVLLVVLLVGIGPSLGAVNGVITKGTLLQIVTLLKNHSHMLPFHHLIVTCREKAIHKPT